MSSILSTIASDHGLDHVLTAAFAAFGTLMSLIAWLFKKRMEAYDKHLEECSKRAIATGRMDERLINVEKNTAWVGNCVMAIGNKIGAELPMKPE